MIESRKKDTIINRIRLQQTRLKAGKFKIGLHVDGLCSKCGMEEDAIHFLLHCKDTEELRENLKNFYGEGINWDFQYLISDQNAIQIIADFITMKNIEV